MDNLRLPRKIKKLFKNKYMNEWDKFLEEKKAYRRREEHIDTVFTRDYNDSRRIFYKMFKHGR